jgi:hypothetical protein
MSIRAIEPIDSVIGGSPTKKRKVAPDMADQANGNHSSLPSTDPAVYDTVGTSWSKLPTNETGWVSRAQEVASILAQDAALRDRDNKSPRAEVALLKKSGLTKVLGPEKYGGGQQSWAVAYKCIREVAKADGSVPMHRLPLENQLD